MSDVTNKTEMVSVPRKLLERLAAYAPEGICGPTALQGFAFEAKRLLDAPAEDVREVVDEPVGRVSYIGNGFVRVRITGDTPMIESMLYHHPQRKVVMPERVDPEFFDSKRETGIGWNACLDEFARLNGGRK